MKSENNSTDAKGIAPFIAMFVLFIFLIILFISSGFSKPPDFQKTQKLDQTWFTPKTARAEIIKTKSLVGNCFVCHMGMVPNPDVSQPKFSHKSIELEHGKNKRCYNCHLIQDRNLLTPDYGPGIVHQKVEELCARCHGIVYNDWQNGTHGSKRGYWMNQDNFNTIRFTCTQCHDPHSPKFRFKDYAPPPVWPEKFIRYSNGEHKSALEKSAQIAGKEAS